MSRPRLCRTCTHFSEIPTGDGSSLYFCNNPKTKEGPNPIGFVHFNAPACSLHESHRSRASSPIVIVYREGEKSAKDEQAPDLIHRLESKIVRWGISLITVAGLLGWLVHDPYLSRLIGIVTQALGLMNRTPHS